MRSSVLLCCVVALLVAGCSPSNNEECLDAATNKPTDAGVKMARQQCFEKFEKPEIERKEEQAKQERAAALKKETEFIQSWVQMAQSGASFGEMVNKFGSPAKQIGLHACSPSKQAPTEKCMTYLWETRPGSFLRTEFTGSGTSYLHWTSPGAFYGELDLDHPEKWFWSDPS